eukprot:CAMPEP_0117422678 /NCGR_PEP_ID=MMETSP0758-20121206/3476_1 /TAXON_ID=63605 /ORGANISM="Percolomonas cosmopolitus, Strain AE-1 (ATCC 50343)" /LENGTH=121 /DNA_ID=CAMNT_0005205455 /DNA_START=2116 /DNA_END=2481 /DNA_ORIENTATION=+
MDKMEKVLPNMLHEENSKFIKKKRENYEEYIFRDRQLEKSLKSRNNSIKEKDIEKKERELQGIKEKGFLVLRVPNEIKKEEVKAYLSKIVDDYLEKVYLEKKESKTNTTKNKNREQPIKDN